MQKDDPRKSLEISPQSIVIVQEMAARINQDGGIYSEKLFFFLSWKPFLFAGIGMIVDYGHEGEKCDTFRVD